jgi:ABC-2 type transport system ATP-binding protein
LVSGLVIDSSPPEVDPSIDAVCVARDLHHCYGDRVALSGVDLDVRPGEVLVLLGPNGSGKTTLFRLLCTLLPVQRGRVRIGGYDCVENPLAVRGQIGMAS